MPTTHAKGCSVSIHVRKTLKNLHHRGFLLHVPNVDSCHTLFPDREQRKRLHFIIQILKNRMEILLSDEIATTTHCGGLKKDSN